MIAVYTLLMPKIYSILLKKRKKGLLVLLTPVLASQQGILVPVYSTDESKQEGQDNRSTLYWNPTVKLDEQGNSKVTFYTSDLYGTYKVVLEGISAEGEIIKSETFFEVKE